MKEEAQSRSSSETSFLSYSLQKGASMIGMLTSAFGKDLPGFAPPHGS